jgi:hypothetical protein
MDFYQTRPDYGQAVAFLQFARESRTQKNQARTRQQTILKQPTTDRRLKTEDGRKNNEIIKKIVGQRSKAEASNFVISFSNEDNGSSRTIAASSM